jgi:hypothetical protein
MDGLREGGRGKKESQQSNLAPGTHKKHKHKNTHRIARPPQKHTWIKLERKSVTSMLLRSEPGGGGGATSTSAWPLPRIMQFLHTHQTAITIIGIAYIYIYTHAHTHTYVCMYILYEIILSPCMPQNHLRYSY